MNHKCCICERDQKRILREENGGMLLAVYTTASDNIKPEPICMNCAKRTLLYSNSNKGGSK